MITYTIIYSPLALVPNALWYKDRRWANVFRGNATLTAPTCNYLDPCTGFFSVAYSTSPGMAVNMEDVGAKYPVSFVDAMVISCEAPIATSCPCPRIFRQRCSGR